MTDALMKYETIDSEQIDALMNREPVPEPKDWIDHDDSDDAASGSSKDGKSDGSIGGPASLH